MNKAPTKLSDLPLKSQEIISKIIRNAVARQSEKVKGEDKTA